MVASASYIDFHSHLTDSGLPPQPSVVYSLSIVDVERLPADGLYTVGLHPWDTDRPNAYKLVENRLRHELARENCLALGEVGLDRLRGAPLPVQVELLESQLRIAREMEMPVVMHCVRAWGELESSVRRAHFEGARALHGYQGHCPVLQELLEAGWYISVRPNHDGSLPAQIVDIPEQQLFLESDGSGIPIDSIYRTASRMRGTSISLLSRAVRRNAGRFFRWPE